MRPRLLGSLSFLLYNLVLAAVLTEGLLALMVFNPRIAAATPAPFHAFVQRIYRHFQRGLVQFEPACATFDERLGYRLRPGTCVFSNIEFANTLRINHLGLRDDEESAVGPEIIVLGDSQAMGWGVEQEETFAQRVEDTLGRRVLNAAISSYGTVRELRLLDELDRSKLRAVVLQYYENDVVENAAFQASGNSLQTMSQSTYEWAVSYNRRQRRYLPGKFLFRLLMKTTRLEEPEPDIFKMDPVTPDQEAELFLNAVQHAGHATLDAVRLVVFEVNEKIGSRRTFIDALERAKAGAGYPPFIRSLVTIDTSTALDRTDFYAVDDHMNARGHQALADQVVTTLRGLGL
jgi:hypothetical protein